MADMNLDELDELEDSEDEAILAEYRNKRIAEMKALAEKSRFGTVREISGQDYVNEVNKAGEGIHVVLHLYEKGIPLCALINQYMVDLAARNPETKFLKSVAKTCIPNFPEKNLPSIFIYYEGQIQKQIIGPVELRGEKLTADEFEYMLGLYEAIKTEIKEDPRQQVKDKLFSDLADTNDWWLTKLLSISIHIKHLILIHFCIFAILEPNIVIVFIYLSHLQNKLRLFCHTLKFDLWTELWIYLFTFLRNGMVWTP